MIESLEIHAPVSHLPCISVQVFKLLARASLFQVHLPHGAVLTVANGKGKRPQFINVWLKASPADYQQTEGEGSNLTVLGIKCQGHCVLISFFVLIKVKIAIEWWFNNSFQTFMATVVYRWSETWIRRYLIIVYLFALGLCGLWDGDKGNDKMMRDGTLFTGKMGKSKQPVEYSRSWR